MNKIKLKIHTWPEEILKKKCKTVRKVDDKVKGFLNEMLSLMRIHSGVGLAANQVGLDLSLIVVEFKDRVLKLVNPCIIRAQGIITLKEGCLSFPDLELEVKRRNKIQVQALNEQGKSIKLKVEGVLSVILQHEIDHINGIVFIDKISLWQKLRVSGKLRAIGKK
ncbi:MAG: peptide deformylase [Candidatus Omnitrophota bacterium]